MNSDLDPVFEDFIRNLEHRLETRIHNTEHIIRDMLIEAFIKVQIDQDQISIEYAPLELPNTRIDLRIAMHGFEFVFELKFHRPSTGNTTRPFPMMAGTVFSDIFKMSKYKIKFPDSKCFLIYVADEKMVNYFRNNCLNDFFDGSSTYVNQQYIDRCKEKNIERSDTFKRYAKTSKNLIDCRIKKISDVEFKTGYCLRIYEIFI